MPRPKPTRDDLKARKLLAEAVKSFAKENLFTEVKLAEVLEVSRRTLQMIKAGKVSPHPGTLRKWQSLVAKYENAASITQLMRDEEPAPSKAKRTRKAA